MWSGKVRSHAWPYFVVGTHFHGAHAAVTIATVSWAVSVVVNRLRVEARRLMAFSQQPCMSHETTNAAQKPGQGAAALAAALSNTTFHSQRTADRHRWPSCRGEGSPPGLRLPCLLHAHSTTLPPSLPDRPPQKLRGSVHGHVGAHRLEHRLELPVRCPAIKDAMVHVSNSGHTSGHPRTSRVFRTIAGMSMPRSAAAAWIR